MDLIAYHPETSLENYDSRYKGSGDSVDVCRLPGRKSFSVSITGTGKLRLIEIKKV